MLLFLFKPVNLPCLTLYCKFKWWPVNYVNYCCFVAWNKISWNSSSMHSVITYFRSIEQFSNDLQKMFRLSVRYLFYQRSKHGLFVFPLKKTLICRPHCSIGQSCCSMMSKRSINWLLESSRAWRFLISPERFLNQPKAIRVCIRSINQSNRSISFRLLFCFFLVCSFQGPTSRYLLISF